MQVNPVVEVDAVDLTTGNINFEGSLQVRGDISATMEVRVTGDVVVNGTMEAALVEAGGNVTVRAASSAWPRRCRMRPVPPAPRTSSAAAS